MTSYAVVIERAADGGYGAWCPDLPGCVALADTEETLLVEMREAIELHLAGLREDGRRSRIPQPWRRPSSLSTQHDPCSVPRPCRWQTGRISASMARADLAAAVPNRQAHITALDSSTTVATPKFPLS